MSVKSWKKFVSARAPKPAREARALPGGEIADDKV